MWTWRPTPRFLWTEHLKGSPRFGFLYFLMEWGENYPPLRLITHFHFIPVHIYSIPTLCIPCELLFRGRHSLRLWKPSATPYSGHRRWHSGEVPPPCHHRGPCPPPRRRLREAEAGTRTGCGYGKAGPIHRLRPYFGHITGGTPARCLLQVVTRGSLSFSAVSLACSRLWDAMNLLSCCFRIPWIAQDQK
jgi:hypothetical protein